MDAHLREGETMTRIARFVHARQLAAPVGGTPRRCLLRSLRSALLGALVLLTCGAPTATRAQDHKPAACADTTPHTIRFVTVAPGVELEVVDWGGSGAAMVLLTGLGDNAHVYDQFAFQFTNFFRVIGITRRGYLPSSQPAIGYDLPTRAADDIAVLDALGIDKAVFVGHSVADTGLHPGRGSRGRQGVAGAVGTHRRTAPRHLRSIHNESKGTLVLVPECRRASPVQEGVATHRCLASQNDPEFCEGERGEHAPAAWRSALCLLHQRGRRRSVDAGVPGNTSTIVSRMIHHRRLSSVFPRAAPAGFHGGGGRSAAGWIAMSALATCLAPAVAWSVSDAETRIAAAVCG
jgi:hypothetical protein